MKAYLITTGVLFTLIGAAHVARTVAQWHRLFSQPSFLVEGPGLGLVAAALAFWSWRLLRHPHPR